MTPTKIHTPPPDCLLLISQYLSSPKQLISLASVSKALYEMIVSRRETSNRTAWATLLRSDWAWDEERFQRMRRFSTPQDLHHETSPHSYYSIYKSLHRIFHPYRDIFLQVYLPLAQLWDYYHTNNNTLKTLEWKHLLDLSRFVHGDGACVEWMNSMEELIGQYLSDEEATVPRELKLFFLLCGPSPAKRPLFGALFVYDLSLLAHPASFRDFLFLYKKYRSWVFMKGGTMVRCCPQQEQSGDSILPVYGFYSNVEHLHVSPSFAQYLSDFVSQLTEYNLQCDPGMMYLNRFPTVPTITHSIHAHRVGKLIGSRVTTRGITVSANAIYIQDSSTEEQAFFAYQIVMRMEKRVEGVPLRCRLLSRHWEICDARQHVDYVDGPGVVGYYPEFDSLEGGEFSYASCCPVERVTKGEPVRNASMGGTFRFLDLDHDEEFDVVVGRYPLTEDVSLL